MNRQKTIVFLIILTVSWNVFGSEERPIDTTPYQIGVFVFSEGAEPFSRNFQERFAESVTDQCRLIVGRFWEVSVSFPEENLSVFRQNCSDGRMGEKTTFDKLYPVVFSRNGGGFHVREFDMKTRWFGPERYTAVENSSKTVDRLIETIFELFSPVFQLEKGARETAFFRVPGSGLSIPEAFRVENKAQDRALLAFVRTLDREGKTITVDRIPWTALVAEEFDPRTKLLRCRVETGLRDPLGARRRGRTEIYALSIPASMAATTLRFLPRKNVEDPANNTVFGTLPIYDVMESIPGESKPVSIGRTRTDGTFLLEPLAGRSVRNIWIKSGRSVIARIPVIRGFETECRVPVPDEPIRLEAEAAILGLQEDWIDVAARRSILKVRLKTGEEKNDLKTINEVRNELSRLKDTDRFLLELDQMRRRFQSDDPLVQRRIERMFDEMKKIILEPKAD